MSLQEHKCPSCGGQLEFNAHFQKMQCLFCGNDYDPDIFRKFDVENEDCDIPQQEKTNVFDNDDIICYICNSCGGEIITDSITIMTKCPFCSNFVVTQDKVKGILKPDYIIPFKYDKYDAIRKYNNYITGKKLLPNIFKDKNHIDEIVGIYVPFWVFNADLHCDAELKIVESSKDTGLPYTSVYTMLRGADVVFEKVPIDASKKIVNELMDSVEPFNFDYAVEFQTAYLSGYLANTYDVERKKCAKIASKIMKKSAIDAIVSTVEGYSEVSLVNSKTKFTSASANYVLCPIWFLNTTFNGQNYTFVMNGQTGKIVGNLPIDKRKYRLTYFIVTILSTFLTTIGSLIVLYFYLGVWLW